jgi:PHD/YefM family antitoxin component YafN of YafNO toxin-antitoxin module
MATQPAIQYISDSDGNPVGVIVPIDLWHEIESERETAYLLKSPTMKTRLLEAMNRHEGISFTNAEANMEQAIPFREVLEAVETLSPDEQETLVDIVKRRLADRARQRLAADIEESRTDFAQGRCQAASVDALMEELLS